MLKKMKNWILCSQINYKGLYEEEKKRADNLDISLTKLVSQIKAVIKESE